MDWLKIVLPIVITTVISIIGYLLKRSFDRQADTNKEMTARFSTYEQETKKRVDEMERKLTDTITKNQTQTDRRVEALERKLGEHIETMPFKYVLRDDYIRTMSNFETKLNEIIKLIRVKDGVGNG